MKRVLVLIIFFVGLIPNLKDMCMESVYDAKGQTLFGEQYEEPFPHCYICGDNLVEVGFGSESVEYCPNCQFYCETCKNAFYKTPDSDDEAIHYSSHENDDDEEEEDNDNNDDNGNNNDYVVIENSYICTTCVIPTVLTEAQKQEHIRLYGHLYYKKVGE